MQAVHRGKQDAGFTECDTCPFVERYGRGKYQKQGSIGCREVGKCGGRKTRYDRRIEQISILGR